MKKINSIAVAIMVAFLFSQFNVLAQDEQEPQVTNVENVMYYCPMHHAVVSDKPGKCEKCGMNLRQKKPGKKMNMMAMMGNPFFEKSVDGLKIQVWIQTQEEHKKMMPVNNNKRSYPMKGKGMMYGMKDSTLMNRMMSGTHHIMVKVIDEKTGKEVGNSVKLQIVSPSQKSISTGLIKRENHFGNGLSLDEKGKYQLTALVTLKTRISKVQFTYEVK